MSETPITTSSSPGTPPSSASEQARIRKERREAKIKAGGSARLNKITGLGGGVQRDPPPQPTVSHGDPDEVDISQHFYEPNTTPRINASPQQQINDDQLRQMMLGFDPSAGKPPGTNPFAGPPGLDGAPGEDPFMKMMQQMMGGAAGEGANGMPAFPGMPNLGQEAVADPYAYIWRIVHAVFALGLGLYIAFTTPFTGTKLAREASGLSFGDTQPGSAAVQFFYIFASAEVILQTSRFFMEKGKVQQAGMIGMVINFLPEPWKGYVELIARYSRIWTQISGDAMTCVFVLGICAWWHGS